MHIPFDPVIILLRIYATDTCPMQRHLYIGYLLWQHLWYNRLQTIANPIKRGLINMYLCMHMHTHTHTLHIYVYIYIYAHIHIHTRIYKSYVAIKKNVVGPAVSIMAMLMDSHVVNHGSSPGPGGLNSRWAWVCVCPRSREENGGEGIAAWPYPLGGDFSLSISLSLSVCLSGEHTRPIAKTSPKKIINK